MSLSAWEQQALDSIKDGLVASDPKLVALLGGFTRLVSDEEMPAHEKVRSSTRWANHRAPRKRRDRRRARTSRYAHPFCRGLGFRGAMMLWLLISAIMIAVALLLSSGGGNKNACTQSWATVCANSARPLSIPNI